MCQLSWDLNSDRYDRSQTTDLNNSPTLYHPTTALTSFVVYNSARRPILLDRLGRCLKLIVSSRGTSCHEFASQFDLEFFIREKTPNQTRPNGVYFKSCMDPLCGQLNKWIGNCRTDPAGWRRAKASCILIMTSTVAECRDPSSNPMQGVSLVNRDKS